MIRLTCANCQAQLEVDDAFAGGVCRCKHCGAIQTVPRRGQSGGSGKTIGGKAGSAGGDEPRTLYQAKSRAGLASTPSGLEELAEAVHGSGLAGSGLLNRQAARGVPRGPAVPPPAKPKASSKVRFWAVAGIAAAVIAAIALILPNVAPGTATGDHKPGESTTGTPAAVEPKFAGTPLAGNKVVYVLDRGDATSGFFPGLRDLTVASVKTLGPDRRFQVILWDNGIVDAYPNLTLGYATAAETEKLNHWFETVATGHSTDALPALRQAVAANPDAIVLATGKSLQLTDAFADSVLALRPPKTIIHAFTLGETAPDDPLRKIAKAAGGRFAALSGPELTPTGE